MTAKQVQGARRGASNVRGFTLVELMLVVAIVGVLAALAFATVTRRLRDPSASALAALQAVRVAQAAYRAHHMTYLNASSAGASWYPSQPAVGTRIAFDNSAHPDAAAWEVLNPSVGGELRVGLRTTAGLPFTAPGPGLQSAALQASFSGLVPDAWWVAEASATQGPRTLYYATTSFSDVVIRDEW